MILVNEDRTSKPGGVRSFFKNKKSLLIILIIFFLSSICWYGKQLVVVIEPENNLPVQVFSSYKGDEWNIYFTHSVQKTPVEEFFRINGVDDMTMTHTRYQSYGVGLPYLPSEGKFTSLKKEGRFDVEMNRPFKSVKLRTAVQAMHKIIHGEKVFDLCALYGQGTLVEVKVMRRYLYWWEYWIKL